MEINKENYEAYLLDLWEGTLSDHQKLMLSNFLKNNPQFDEEEALTLTDDISIKEPAIQFDKAAIDFDEINTKNYEFFFVAYCEGDLSNKEKSLVDVFLAEHPSLQQKFTQFTKAKLPEETILYPNKEQLNSIPNSSMSLPIKRWIGLFAAASILVSLFLTFPFEGVESRYEMSETQELDIDKLLSKKIKNENKTIKKRLKTTQSTDFQNKNKKSIENRLQMADKPTKSIKGQRETKIKVTKTEKKDNLKLNAGIKDNDISEAMTSLASGLKTEQDNNLEKQISSTNKIQTLAEITNDFLRRKQVINEEGKANITAMINNTFSEINKNKKPIITIEDKPETKTTIFQLGAFKIERKTKK
ncbi:hypothetical protein [Brumimicrobium oceani]|uniref:Uncharacterized protein n=1 Tax=Brumimicrobium oceani TaxID=2100725 RepID=A0A2U2XGY9_9FLAO|nr:hypothetical protein [Brumimicrobium oceani]PWH86981.1 hypothetical protein DIT68_01605 [Brumimicrobium oceani]